MLFRSSAKEHVTRCNRHTMMLYIIMFSVVVNKIYVMLGVARVHSSEHSSISNAEC